MLNIGDTVKFTKPLTSDEVEARFTVLELRGDRVLVEMISSFNWKLKPTTVLPLVELIKA